MTKSILTRGINWNRLEDPKDGEVWNRLNANFWLPEKVPLSGDVKSWGLLTQQERDLVLKVFTGLTMLDTIQSSVGAPSMAEDAKTLHEEACFAQISYMEAVHAKSYSSIFSTLCSTREIDDAFDWSENNKYLQMKGLLLQNAYRGSCEHKRKIVSVLMESFLFYSGFYTPFHFAARGKLPNTADIIRLILRDESVHGYYIGYKYQRGIETLSAEERAKLEDFTFDTLSDLMDNEQKYAADLYDEVGLTEQVKRYMYFNANKALNNLGYPSLYPPQICDVSPEILTAMDPGANETHDFFSGSGSSYVVGTAEATTNDDWNF